MTIIQKRKELQSLHRKLAAFAPFESENARRHAERIVDEAICLMREVLLDRMIRIVGRMIEALEEKNERAAHSA